MSKKKLAQPSDVATKTFKAIEDWQNTQISPRALVKRLSIIFGSYPAISEAERKGRIDEHGRTCARCTWSRRDHWRGKEKCARLVELETMSFDPRAYLPQEESERQRQSGSLVRIEYRHPQKSEYDEKEVVVTINLLMALRGVLELKCHRAEKPEITCPHCAALAELRQFVKKLEGKK